MKLTNQIYVLAAEQISIQQPLSLEWMDTPIVPDGAYNEAVDPSFKEWLSPGEARRLGNIMKRAVATSFESMKKSGVEKPDAIITATGLGCVKNTELFLTDLCTGGESLLKPTQFMQSTHNTIGSLIAILTNNHGYNVTYANGDISTETALNDALIQLELGEISTALVGSHDEMTPSYYTLLERIGYYGTPGMVTSGETAVSIMLSTGNKEKALCKIDSIDIMYNPEKEKVAQIFKQLGKIDAVIGGFNGRSDSDNHYRQLIGKYLPDSTVLQYKNLFGESMTSSAFGIYVAINILKHQRWPKAMFASGPQNEGINTAVCVNISGKHLTVIKLTRV